MKASFIFVMCVVQIVQPIYSNAAKETVVESAADSQCDTTQQAATQVPPAYNHNMTLAVQTPQTAITPLTLTQNLQESLETVCNNLYAFYQPTKHLLSQLQLDESQKDKDLMNEIIALDTNFAKAFHENPRQLRNDARYIMQLIKDKRIELPSDYSNLLNLVIHIFTSPYRTATKH